MVRDRSGNKPLVESLHLLFTLFKEFQDNQHFTGGVIAGIGDGMG